MNDSPAACTVWNHLVTLGCTRTHSEHVDHAGHAVHRVVIRRHGEVIATGEHAIPGLASSRALLDAIQLLAPPATPRVTALRPLRAPDATTFLNRRGTALGPGQ